MKYPTFGLLLAALVLAHMVAWESEMVCIYRCARRWLSNWDTLYRSSFHFSLLS